MFVGENTFAVIRSMRGKVGSGRQVTNIL